MLQSKEPPFLPEMGICLVVTDVDQVNIYVIDDDKGFFSVCTYLCQF